MKFINPYYIKASAPLAIAAVNRYFNAHTVTTTLKKPKMRAKSFNHGRTGFKHLKPKAIDSWPKGLSHKFEKKVKKCLEVDQSYGKYTYVSRLRCYQKEIDEWRAEEVDENGMILEFACPKQWLDAASILFNQKVAKKDWGITTGNLNSEFKHEIIKCSWDMFFKSTSGHVINIEVYECKPKANTSAGAIGSAIVSYNNASNFSNYYDPTNPSGIRNDLKRLSTTAEDWTQLYEYFHVKKHVVKLLPGESASLHGKGPSHKTIDLTKCMDNDNLVSYSPHTGSTVFFTRTINDISVSKTSGFVYHWPSNTQGGAAVEFKRTYMMRPPPGETTNLLQKPVIVTSLWALGTGTSTDQQVADAQPNTSTVNDI